MVNVQFFTASLLKLFSIYGKKQLFSNWTALTQEQ